MSECTIFVELDEPARHYTPGDTVRGEVHVTVDSDSKYDAINVELAWETHGQGDHAEGVHMRDVPFQGQWTDGMEHRYPFEFVLPNGPYTYHGHNLNVDWYVRATADVPWAIDPKAKAEVRLGPGDDSDSDSYINCGEFHGGLAQLQSRGSRGAGCLFLVALPFLGFGLVAMVAPFMDRSDDVSMFTALFGLVFTAVGGAMLFGALRDRLAKMKLGKIDVVLPDGALHPGDDLTVTVNVDTAARGELDEITATLVCRERVVSGSGNSRRTQTEDILNEPLVLQENPGASGPGLVVEGTHRIPDAAAPSFYANSNELLWLVEVHVDLPNWPDYTHEHYFEVRPKAGTGRREAKSASDEPASEPAAVW